MLKKIGKIALLKNLTLLLVDDDNEFLSTLKEIFSVFFKNIVIAHDGQEALLCYHQQKIDVIISDFVMPHLNGHELCVKIREQNATIPIVIMSSYSEFDHLVKLIPLNLTRYTQKPLDHTTILDTLYDISTQIEKEGNFKRKITSVLEYDINTKTLINTQMDCTVPLTKSEYLLLELLTDQQNTLVSNEMIEYALSPIEEKSEQAIKNLVYRLRQKIGKDSIVNMHGLGYVLNPSSK